MLSYVLLPLRYKKNKNMEYLRTAINKIMVVVSLITALGVFMHDGRVDRAAITALHRPFDLIESPLELSDRVRTFVETDAHTHPDHNAARSSLLNSFAYQSPSVPPRKNQHQVLAEAGINGARHAFDNANLPIVA